MKTLDRILPVGLLTATALLLTPAASNAYFLTGDSLDVTQRDFRIFNNFTDPAANDNQALDPDFPGATGAVLAIWKGVAEWGSSVHGSGTSDPSQADGIGSGGANFDPFFLGEADLVGGMNANIISQKNGFGGGILAFAELPTSDGWRIRFLEDPTTWDDGPGILQSHFDLQGVAAHEYGHALGLDHSGVPGATMSTNSTDHGVGLRSIEEDDRNGLQAIYGVRSATKPRIDTYALAAGSTVTILGVHFAPEANEVWFTHGSIVGGINAAPVVVADVVSCLGGTRIDVTLPIEAGAGEVLVKVPGTHAASLSNAFPFDPEGSPCVAPLAFGSAKPTSSGSLPEILWQGLPSASIGKFSIALRGASPSGKGLLFSGPAALDRPFLGGTLLVGGPRVRERLFDIEAGEATVDIAVTPDLVGTTRYYQMWFRDPGDPWGAGLSDGLQVTFCH